jgi:hypothetical protein
MPVFREQALVIALEQALGHPAPFTDDECRLLVGPLCIQHALDLSSLRHFPHLRHLEIFASDINDLDVLGELQHLRKLTIIASSLSDIEAIAECVELESLTLNFTLVEDLAPILDLPKLKRGALIGNPWTSQSYYELRPQLLQKNNGHGPLLEFSSEQDWKFGRRLIENGLPITFSGLDDTRRVIVRPGVPIFTSAACDFVADREYAVEFLLFELDRMSQVTAQVIESLFDMLPKDERQNPSRSFDLTSHRVLGYADDARRWVEFSQLEPDWKQSLLHFVNEFPALVFYQEDETIIAGIEAMTSVALPRWFRDVRTTLAFVLPGQRLLINFDREAVSHLAGDFQFEFNQFAVNWDQRERFARGSERIVPFSLATSPDIQSLLAFNVADTTDRYIYMYNIESLNDPYYQEHSMSDALRIVFDSYADMLAHIASVTIVNNLI